MRSFRPLLPLLFAAITLPSAAAVYRCDHNGKPVYTDKPCNNGAEQTPLPALTTIAPEPHAAKLSDQYDADVARRHKARDKADAEWLQQRQRSDTQAASIRKALIDGNVVKGMTSDQVQQVLNLPARVEDPGGAHERWIYQNGRTRRTITFSNGVVSADSSRTSRK